jgi:hypothetical protein
MPSRILVAISPGEEERLKQTLQDWLDEQIGVPGLATVTVGEE